MPGLRQLAAIEGIAIAALITAAGALAVFGFAGSMGNREAAALVWFLGTTIFGAPFVLLFGAPAYWALARRDKATWLPVLAVGLAPGAFILLADTRFGLLSLGCGAAVAALTHWWCGRFELNRSPARRLGGR